MTIQAQIRFIAAMRVKVHITRKTRSPKGFIVTHPPDKHGKTQTPARTKREAFAVLLAKVKTTEPLTFQIKEQN